MKKLISLKAVLMAFAAFILVGFAATSQVKAETTPTPTPEATTYAYASSVTSWNYDAANDALSIMNKAKTATVDKLYIYSIKDDQAQTLKKESKSIALQDTATASAVHFSKTVSCAKPEISIALNKTIYLAMSNDKPNAKGKEITANIVIAPSTVKSGKLTFNYAAVSTRSALNPIGSYVLDLNGDSKTSLPADTKSWNPRNAGTKEEYVTVSDADINNTLFKYLEFSLDDQKNWTTMDNLTGDMIYQQSVAAKPAKFYWRVAGVDAEGENATTAVKTAVRPSKVMSMSIGKAPKAPSVKIDVKKYTINLKNGMDYQVVASGTAINELTAGWTTVLPYNKDEGAAAVATKATATVVIYPKYDSENASCKTNFTKTKVTTLDLNSAEFLGKAEVKTEGGLNIAFRKSATKSAPASAYGQTGIMSVPAEGPTVSIAATAGGLKFVVTGKTGATFEYLVVKKADDKKVDVASINWKKLDSNKTVVKYNAKSDKYVRTDTPADDKGKKEKQESSALEVGDYIYIRSQGVPYKKGKVEIPILPSEYTKIEITKIVDEKPYALVGRVIAGEPE